MNVKKSTIIFATVEILFQIFLAFGVFFKKFTNGGSYFILISTLIASILSSIFIFIIPKLLRNKSEEDDFKEYLQQYRKKTNILIYILAIVVTLSLMPISIIVQNVINTLLEKSGHYIIKSTVDDIFQPSLINDKGYQALIILSVAIFIPIREELTFRSLLMRGFRDFGTYTAILVGSMVFAFVHGGLDQFFPQLFLAILMGIIYFKTENIFITIIMHISNNLSVTLLSLYGEKFIKKLGELNQQYIIIIIFSTIIILIISMLLINFIATRKNKKIEEGYFMSNKKFIWSNTQYSRYKQKKDVFSYLSIIVITLICFVLWISAILSKIK